jgi:hypothetical protein
LSASSHPDRHDFERLDAMGRAERELLLDHVAACARCRRELASDDPVRAFALLGRFDPPAERLDELSGRVAAAIDAADRREPARAPVRVWGALAAALLLAGAISWVVGLGPTPRAPLPVDAGPMSETASIEPMAVPVAPEPLRVSGPSGGGQVVEMTVGDARLVMIFDDDLDL